jgi:large subunit ribosomal protein L9
VKIILKADVRDLGHTGDLVEVKPGYARNYLLPRSLAVPATPGNLKDYQKKISAAKERDERERTAANALADRLRGQRVVLIRRAAEGSTRLHGSVTAPEIAQEIAKLAGKEIDRRDVDLRQPIRALGDYKVNLKVMKGLSVPIKVIVAETEPVETPEAPEVEEETAAAATAAAPEVEDEGAEEEAAV